MGGLLWMAPCEKRVGNAGGFLVQKTGWQKGTEH